MNIPLREFMPPGSFAAGLPGFRQALEAQESPPKRRKSDIFIVGVTEPVMWHREALVMLVAITAGGCAAPSYMTPPQRTEVIVRVNWSTYDQIIRRCGAENIACATI